MVHRITILTIIITTLIIGLLHRCYGCELDQTQNGCRFENGGCTCAYGCKSDYRYATRKECLDALKGRSNDICGQTPCYNNGSCIQVSQMPGYKCRCEGTGFWGSRCQRQCPGPNDHHVTHYPYECIII